MTRDEKNDKKKDTKYHEDTSPVEIEEGLNDRNDDKIE